MKRLLLISGLVLVLLGIVAVVHPTFEYSRQQQVAKFGPVQATFDEPQTFEVPVADNRRTPDFRTGAHDRLTQNQTASEPLVLAGNVSGLPNSGKLARF